MKPAPLALLLVCGCGFPYQTPPATPEELTAIDELTRAISDHADRTGDLLDRGVADELRKAPIAIFDDDPCVGGYLSYGTTRLGRVYLYAGLFGPLRRRETLRVLYHEGVHLTQGWWRLLTDSAGAEDEALQRQDDFLKRYREAGKR